MVSTLIKRNLTINNKIDKSRSLTVNRPVLYIGISPGISIKRSGVLIFSRSKSTQPACVYLAENGFQNAERAFRNSISYKSVDPLLSHNNVGVILAMNSEFAAAERNLRPLWFYGAADW